jgi:hypothetical protein
VARVVPGAAEVIDRVCTLDYSQPGKPPIDWDDPVAKQNLVSDLVNDALAVLAELCGDDAPQREDTAAEALGLLALVAGQDVEPAQDSDGTDGRWLWVPNRSSASLTCGIAGRWSSGMIAARGGSTVVSDLPAAHGLAGTAGP